MADHIIIEWSRNRLRLLTATEASGRLTVQSLAALEGTDHFSASVPASEAGEQVKKWLEESKVAKGHCRVVVPRDLVVVRHLQLPDAPDDELPDLVRFQAATKASAPIDSLALDYLPLQKTDSEAGRNVVTFTMDRDRVARITNVLLAAGLEVDQITTSSLTVSQLVQKAVPGAGHHQPDLVVYQDQQHMEIAILDGGTTIFTHSSQLPSEPGADRLKPLKSDLTRSMVALSQSHPDVSIQRCFYVSGTPEEPVQNFLQQRFPEGYQHLTTAESLQGKEITGYESLAGALLSGSHDRLKIDFLHPRKKREIPDRRKLYYSIGAALVALVLISGFMTFRSQKNHLESEIQLVQDEISDTQKRITAGEPRDKTHNLLAKWKEGEADILVLWATFQQYLPGTDRIYFSNLKVTPQRGEVLATFNGMGRAKERSDVNVLTQTLSDRGFSVKPTTLATRPGDSEYPIGFELNVDLPRTIVEKPTNPPATVAANQ